jgi:hypothetical protein
MKGMRLVARFIAFATLSVLGSSDLADVIRLLNFEAFEVSFAIDGSSFEPRINIDVTLFPRKVHTAIRLSCASCSLHWPV